MIRPLRSAHRSVFFVLLPLLPATYVVALLSRSPEPTMEVLPDALTTAGDVADERGRFEDLWQQHGLRVIVSGPPARISVESTGIVPSPDLLAYVAPADAARGVQLPEGAVLLGSLGEAGLRSFPLPEAAAAEQVIFYSLGHGSRLASLRLDSSVIAAASAPEAE